MLLMVYSRVPEKDTTRFKYTLPVTVPDDCFRHLRTVRPHHRWLRHSGKTPP